MSESSFSAQEFVDELIKKENEKIKLEKDFNDKVLTYGAVQFNDGTVIKVKKNFFFLEQMWQMYVLYKAFGDKEQMKKILIDTNGGLFDCGDVVFKLDDVKVLFRSQLYNNASEEEKENFLFKNSLINNHLDETIYIDGFEKDFPDEEEGSYDN